MQTAKRRSGIRIMGQLIGLVRPLIGVMLMAIALGTTGYLCAIFLTVIAGGIVNNILLESPQTLHLLSTVSPQDYTAAHRFTGLSVTTLMVVMVLIAVLRGILHYAEQYCNHFIAFKLLAIIRHQVFAKLRKLCPAKLEGKDKGNLIAILTSDIELLEVFYAHTISPIAIAFLTSLLMTIFIGQFHWLCGLLAACAYLVVGVMIPLWNGRRGAQIGLDYRNAFGKLNSFVLDSLRGVDETIQYGQGAQRKADISRHSKALGMLQKDLSTKEGSQRSLTNLVILLFSFGMLFLNLYLYQTQALPFEGVLLATIAMMSSFGPVTALSGLSNNLNQTLASGERVLSLLEEEPVVEEIPDGAEGDDSVQSMKKNAAYGQAEVLADAEHVTFSYAEKEVLSDFSLGAQPGKIIGIHGRSGCGKSTLLKLFMRFWDTNTGEVKLNGHNVKTIPTRQLRDTESFVTQETALFHDTIANNIRIAKQDATMEEIEEAAKKASIHEFIMSLPQGYETMVGELGDTLSGGERQRIGVARAFLHDAPLILLDEPTSNLDSLNEGIILKSLKEHQKKKTILLVSHRKSTMRVADAVVEMESENR